MEIALGPVGSSVTDWRQMTDVAHDQIARRAYELYVARGRETGHDLDDWLTAQRDIQAAPLARRR